MGKSEEFAQRNMVLHIIKSWPPNSVSLHIFGRLITNTKSLYFLLMVLMLELSSTTEAKSVTKAMNAYKNVTLVSKAGRYLTIGTQGITGEDSSSIYGRND